MLSLYWPKASFWDYPAMIVFWRTFAAFSFGMLILLACSIRNQRIVDATMPLRYLGTISYGIYLWHLPVILSIQRIEGLPPGKALVLVLVLTILLASWSWHFFERQFISAGKPHIVSG
jgi:peptidoglycan/LPS O-acetylase OafA/YrhL